LPHPAFFSCWPFIISLNLKRESQKAFEKLPGILHTGAEAQKYFLLTLRSVKHKWTTGNLKA
jgi:hypothetical protein